MFEPTRPGTPCFWRAPAWSCMPGSWRWVSVRSPQSGRALIESVWLSGLSLAAVGVQFVVPTGAASGYDLSKWAGVNYLPGSAGYFQIARKQAARDPWRFLADYPRWIRNQDVFHIGTHPPGLIVTQCVLLGIMERSPALSGFLIDPYAQRRSRRDSAYLRVQDPRSLVAGRPGRPVRDGPAHAVGVRRDGGSALSAGTCGTACAIAWAAAALWPLAPAANLFQPVADTAYPLISTSALALAAWAAKFSEIADRPAYTGLILAAASGVMMALGMAFTLAFLPVGVIVAIVISFNSSIAWHRRGCADPGNRCRLSGGFAGRMGGDRGRPFCDRLVEPAGTMPISTSIIRGLIASGFWSTRSS